MRIMLPIFALYLLCFTQGAVLAANGLAPVPVTSVHLEDTFWAPRIILNRDKVIPHNFDFCEKTGRITNFDKAAGTMPGNFEGIYFNDSDLYKVIEGAAHSLAHERDAKLETYVDGIIDRIAAAQRPDGYLYTYYTVRKELDKRWSNTPAMHELYCAGHFFEAAVAYYQATGKRKILDVAIKLADHIDSTFGPDKRRDVPGHEEIELALVKLARITGDQKYFKLAQFFINERGHANGRKLQGEYSLDDTPLVNRTEIAGHAVRAMYFFAGAADVAAATGDQATIKALDTIWHDVVDRKMYITGGIGPSAQNEGFTVPYDLPNDSAYAETCAAIGMVFWNYRMALLHGDAKYADVMERCMYNGSISGVSLDGQKYFYTNRLGSRGDQHRQPWFDCACCPTNIARFLPNIGGYMYAGVGDDLYVNLYARSRSKIPTTAGKLEIAQDTQYPWDGQVKLTINIDKPRTFAVRIRVPGWCKGATLKVDGAEKPLNVQAGYAVISQEWKDGSVVELNLPMPVERVYADPHVKADVGRVALQRGPIVYCLEGVDNDGWVRNLVLPKDSKLAAEFRPDLLNGVTVVKGTALSIERGKDPRPVQFTAVPYYAWDNRAPGQMVVWLPEDPALAEPRPAPTIAGQARASASHKWQADSLEALNDQAEPADSNDHSIPRFTWFNHKGTQEWVQYDFKSPTSVREVEVYFFDDAKNRGECRLPASWKILYKTGDRWETVPNASEYTVAPNKYNKMTFDSVTASALRLVVQLKPGFSGGILEWKVN